MFYYTSLVIVTLFTIGFNGISSRVFADEPKRCCVPKQFSSAMSVSSGVALPGGQVIASYGSYNFSYDSDRGMVGMKGESVSAFDQKKSNLWIIENITDGSTFTFDMDTKQCYKSLMPIRLISCLPDSAVYMRSVTYGYGDKQIIGDTWLVTIDNSITYSTISRDGLCIPMNGHSFLQNPPVVTGSTITDFVPKILDPSIFDIPEQCKFAV